jgi:glutamate mutase epsilon subunit
MLSAFLQWLFSFKFTQNTSAAVVGTAITAAPLFGILDKKITDEIQQVKVEISQKATIVSVQHQDEVLQLEITDLIKTLNKIEKNQEITNSQLWQLVNKGR